MKVNEIAGVGNHNTALFWEYDTRLGRRWNIDPIKQPNQSVYSVFADNPIIYNDVLGDTWKDKESKSAADKFRSDTKRLIADIDAVVSLNENLLKKDINDNQRSKFTNQNTRLLAKKKELETALSEMDDLESSSTDYMLSKKSESMNKRYTGTKEGGFTEEKGYTYYGLKINSVVMEYTDLASEAHELKHGWQFEMKRVSFTADGQGPGTAYDLTDEQESRTRESAYGRLHSYLTVQTFEHIVKQGYKASWSTSPINVFMNFLEASKAKNVYGQTIYELTNPDSGQAPFTDLLNYRDEIYKK